MDKVYDHTLYEEKIYKLWEEENTFSPQIIKGKKPFVIIMPPPNANDPLHIGHARFVAIEDTLARYHRMKGDPTLWLPGSDHAGIETQFVFEKKLKEKGQSRFDFDRDTLYKLIWEYVEGNTSTMHEQLKKLGSSCDWSRHKFTLDPNIVKIVNQTFKELWDEGLIYRGKKIVNYCTRCGTAFSQLEVDVVERQDPLYVLDYGSIKIATTRPETIFADVAVAVNPKDARYKDLVGKTATVPLVNREIPIIADSQVDPEFGTGALKITPGHDALDFEIGQKHKLQTISVIDFEGKMTSTPEKYVGMRVAAAREEVVNDLKEADKIVEEKTLTHTIGTCYRDKSVIEPMLSDQWFVKVNSLASNALAAIDDKKVVFPAEKYKKIARHWLKNLNDWNISRQIVWGIQIPAFRCQKCLEWTITTGEAPEKCNHCGGETLVQDTDTFDTWFSSGQWPFATLKTGKEGDFEYFYPTTVMETGYDILPFWVIRMLMLGLYKTKQVPFTTVLLHGLVRDKEGQKISKSKGNVIDPVQMAQKYGADALRMGILWGALIENDISLSEDNIKAQRNFANKIWNVSRFVFSEYEGTSSGKAIHEDDKWIKAELKKTTKKVTLLLEKYRLSEAANELYSFVWKTFADQYLEKTKTRRADAQPTLEYVLENTLKLLHPFMPFVTEQIWQINKDKFSSPHLILAPWPK
jgi:valyl-tRNA synthetase